MTFSLKISNSPEKYRLFLHTDGSNLENKVEAIQVLKNGTISGTGKVTFL